MVTLIEALGSLPFKYLLLIFIILFLGPRYDGDIRIGFWQVGFLGHWGEWHTWPNDTYFASKNHQDQIISAFNSSFIKTKTLLRFYDVTGTNNATSLNVGFHDDGFDVDTYYNDGMLYNMSVAVGAEDQLKSHVRFYNMSVAVGAQNQWKTHVSSTSIFSLCITTHSSSP
jgi:hypothetical protein